MKKNVVNKIIAAALASALVVSMPACGDTKTPASGSIADASSSADVSGSAASSSATAEPTTEPGPDMTPLSITIALPADSEHVEANKWYDELTAQLNDYLQMDITWKWKTMSAYNDQVEMDIIAGDVIRLLPGVRSTAFFTGTYMVSLDDLAGIVTSTVVPLLTVDSTAFT